MNLFSQKGLGWIEIIIVVSLVVIIVGAMMLEVNPLKQVSLARNASRRAGLNAIATAIYQNILANSGNFVCSSGDIPEEETMMAWPGANNVFDIAACLTPLYLKKIPIDPIKKLAYWSYPPKYITGYTIKKVNGIIILRAPWDEDGKEIKIER